MKKGSNSFLIITTIIVFLSMGGVIYLILSIMNDDKQPLTNDEVVKVEENTEKVEEDNDNTTETKKDTYRKSNSTYYQPNLIVKGDTFEFEGEVLSYQPVSSAETFLQESFDEIGNMNQVKVTELISEERGEDLYKTLRTVDIDYAKLATHQLFKVKHNEGEAQMTTEVFSNDSSIVTTMVNENGEPETTYSEKEVTYDNLIEEVSLGDIKYSPIHLSEAFSSPETRPRDLMLGVNDEYFVFYKEKTENVFEEVQYSLEAYMFDKVTKQPLRVLLYESHTIDNQVDFTTKEIVYGEWNKQISFNFPDSSDD